MDTAAATRDIGSAVHGVRGAHRYFYLSIALSLALLVFLAFTRTFWAPVAAGSLTLHPAIVVHGALFFLWTVFFVVQTVLPVAGRVAWHRGLGLLGIALAAFMFFSGILAQIVVLNAALPGPFPQRTLTGAVLSFSGMTMFGTFITLAIASIKRPDRHKRLMVLATFSILQAAIARVIMLFPSISQPLRVSIGAVVTDVLLLAVVAIDARARGRVHPVYAAGAAFIVLVQYLRSVVVRTDGFAQFAAWLAALGT